MTLQHARVICRWTLSVSGSSQFLELRSQKTISFSDQMMSADKYPSIFSRQVEAIVYLVSRLETTSQTAYVAILN